MALENSSFGLLSPDYFNKPKTLASNATAVPKPLAKATYVPPGTTQAGTNYNAQSSNIAPLPSPMPEVRGDRSAPSTVKAPDPYAGYQAELKRKQDEAATKRQYGEGFQNTIDAKALEQTTKAVQEKIKALPVPSTTTSKDNVKTLDSSAPKPMSFEEAFKPVEDLFKQQQNVLTQQQVADTQFKKDQLSQQLNEMEAQGTGIGNAFYRTLMRDQDSNFATTRRGITEQYLSTKGKALESERSIEQARQDDLRDQRFEMLMSIGDSKIAMEFAKGVLELDPDDQMFSSLVNNTGYWKARELESDAKFMEQSKLYQQQAQSIIDNPTLTESDKRSGWESNLIKSLPDVNLSAKGWASSEQARQDLIDAYGSEEAGNAAYKNLLETGEEGLKEAYLDARYAKAKSENEKTKSYNKLMSTFPPADTKQEEQANKQIAELASNGALAGVVKVDIDGSGNMIGFGFDLNKYGMEGTLESYDPGKVPGIDMIFKDWDGKEYNGTFTKDLDPEWMQELDVSYKTYLDGFKKGDTLLNRDEFRKVVTESDGQTLRQGKVSDLIKAEAAKNTPAGILEAINKNEFNADDLTDEQFRMISSDPDSKNTITQSGAFTKMPEVGSNIQKTNDNFNPNSLNPPKLIYLEKDGKVIPYKIRNIRTIQGKKGKNELLEFNYVDAYGNIKLYTVSYNIAKASHGNKTNNGIPIEFVVRK